MSSTPVTRSTSANSQHGYSQPESTNLPGRLAYIWNITTTQKSSIRAHPLSMKKLNHHSAWSGNSGVLTKTSIQLIEPVASFPAAQFHNSHPYLSLNSYRSAISSIHLKTEGFDVSKHLLIHSLMKDTVNKHLPVPSIRQPGLFLTWSLI